LGFDLIQLANRERSKAPVKDLEHFELRLAYERITAKETSDFTKLDALKSALNDAGLEVRMLKDAVELKPGPDFDPSKLEALK
jgi:cysteinyl-tRNA synthetase